MTIDAANDPVVPHPNVAEIESSRVASVEVHVPDVGGEPGGWDDYSGPFDPEFQLEDLSQRALVVTCQEVAVQSHLLFRSYLLAAAQAFGWAEAATLGPRVFTGLGGITAQRLSVAMGVGEGAVGIAKLLQLHPMFWPRTYVDLEVELGEDEQVRVSLRTCPALEGEDGLTWFAGLGGPSDRALDAIVQAVDPRARCVPSRLRTGERFAYTVEIEPDAEPATDPDEVVLAKISTGSAFVFSPRRRPQLSRGSSFQHRRLHHDGRDEGAAVLRRSSSWRHDRFEVTQRGWTPIPSRSTIPAGSRRLSHCDVAGGFGGASILPRIAEGKGR